MRIRVGAWCCAVPDPDHHIGSTEGHPAGVPLSRGRVGAGGTDSAARLELVVQEARRRSLIGPAAFEAQMAHCQGFVELTRRHLYEQPGAVLDLGSGGGLPGLVVAAELGQAEPGQPEDRQPEDRQVELGSVAVVLLDAAARRCSFLSWAVGELGLEARVRVLHARAEVAARGELREGFSVVTSRAFGSPSATAECARGFLADGGVLVVSEPPSSAASESRWNEDALVSLGYGTPALTTANGHRFVTIQAGGRCPDSVPRRDGLPARRPFF